MKAVLRSHAGVLSTIAIHPPPPPYIRMAVSDSGGQIWNPGDLMESEKQLFKEKKFLKQSDLGEGIWLYVEEMPPEDKVSMASVSKAILDKLRPAIIDAVSAPNLFAAAYKKNKAKMEEDEASKICIKHQQAFQYDNVTGDRMALLGSKLHPEETESAWDYLTRLYTLVREEEDKLKALTNPAYSKYLSQIEAEKQYAKQLQEKQYQQYAAMQNQSQNKWLSEFAVSTAQTSQTYGYGYGGLVPAAPTPVPIPPKVEAPPEPKKELPDPVTPKKRMMKRS